MIQLFASHQNGDAKTAVLVSPLDWKLEHGTGFGWNLDMYEYIYIDIQLYTYITLHYIALHCIALHCVALRCVALHCIHIFKYTCMYVSMYLSNYIYTHTCICIYVYICRKANEICRQIPWPLAWKTSTRSQRGIQMGWSAGAPYHVETALKPTIPNPLGPVRVELNLGEMAGDQFRIGKHADHMGIYHGKFLIPMGIQPEKPSVSNGKGRCESKAAYQKPLGAGNCHGSKMKELPWVKG